MLILGFSAENASLHIPFQDSKPFSNDGYANIVTNSSYDGGLVREHGELSFSRVLQAGHSAGGFQPETMSKVFERATFRNDFVTGKIDLAKIKSYASEGKADVRDIKHELPGLVENVCYVLYAVNTCTCEQMQALINVSADTENWIVTSPKGTKDGETKENRAACEGGSESAGGNDGESGGDNDGSGNGDSNGSDDPQCTGAKLSVSLGFFGASVAGMLALV